MMPMTEVKSTMARSGVYTSLNPRILRIHWRGLKIKLYKAVDFIGIAHFALLGLGNGFLDYCNDLYLHRNKIPYYEKYYHYVENCLFTPIYLPRMLPIK